MEIFDKLFGVVVGIPIEQVTSNIAYISIAVGAQNCDQFMDFIICPCPFELIFELLNVPVVVVRGI